LKHFKSVNDGFELDNCVIKNFGGLRMEGQNAVDMTNAINQLLGYEQHSCHQKQ